MNLRVLHLFFSLFISLCVLAQRKAPTHAIFEVAQIPFDTTFQALKWRNVGPFRGGRSNAVAGVRGNNQLYYVGYTGGGIWKTEDAGLTFSNISDGFFETTTIGDIAVSETDPNTIYVGTGEHAVRGVMTTFGDGVYKSTDAGKTWKNIGLQKTRHIADIAIHPNNPDIVFVAAQGALHGNNSERGIYKSTNGGESWKKVLYINDSTGISSLSLDMNNPRVLYASSWQHRRLPWTVQSGGKDCGIWKSVDAGETWVKINNGLPDFMGKIGVSVSRANSSKVFAIVEAEKSKSGIYRSDDAGKTWSFLSGNQDLTARSWYYMKIAADPMNENFVYIMNAPLMRSIDGGKNWSSLKIGHGDTHDLWINPDNNKQMILGDDGGGEISLNSGKTWSSLNNQPTAQFYRVNVDNQFPYKIYGGQQDNSSVIIDSRSNGMGITEKNWISGPGCESAYLAFDPNNPVKIYGGCYQGYIEVLDIATNEKKDIQAYPTMNLAIQPRNMKYRFNWNAPIIASPHDPKTIYHAGNVLFKTTNGGINWDVISPDLTRNDTAKQGQGGGPLTNEGAGGENYNTIYYVSESTLEKGVIWTGSDCGLIHLTIDGGKSWNNVTPSGLPECLIQSIELSPHEKGVAYISATRYKFNDFAPYAYKTLDYGKTWTKINNGIRSDDFLKVIREDKKVKGLLYGGAERGFYLSYDGGNNWQRLQLNLPVVPITDLIIHDNDLVASTAGRAFWILDDLSALQQFPQTATIKLFQPKPGIRYPGGGLAGTPNPLVGTNAPEGIILDYYLTEKADTNTLKLEILTPSGKSIRSYTNKKNEDIKSYPGGPSPDLILSDAKGINRFLWDFRNEHVPEVQGVYIYGSYSGHRLAPGKYLARLSFKGNISETQVEILQDPKLSISKEIWSEQQMMLEKIEADITEMHLTVNTMRKARKQIAVLNESIKDSIRFKVLVDEGKTLMAAIEKWEKNIVEEKITNGQDVINWPSKLNAEFFNLHGLIDSHDPTVTQGTKNRFTDLENQWNEFKSKYSNDIKTAIKVYNQHYQEAKVPAVLIN